MGIQFGPDVTKEFLKENNLIYVIRSHEVKPEGWERHHDGKCYTIFSAPNYCDTIGYIFIIYAFIRPNFSMYNVVLSRNKGAFITFTGDQVYPPKITTFEAVPHPPIKSMAYASSFLNFLA